MQQENQTDFSGNDLDAVHDMGAVDDRDSNVRQQDTSDNENNSKKGQQKKKPFPLVPALVAVFVVVGGGLGWQWWVHNHRASALPTALPTGSEGSGFAANHDAPQQYGLQPQVGGLMAMDTATQPAAIGHGQGSTGAAAPPPPPLQHASAPASAPVSPHGATAVVPSASKPALSPSTAASSPASAGTPQSVDVTVSPTATGVQQATPAATPSTAEISARLDAMDQEIKALAGRVAAIQSSLKADRLKTNQTHAAAPRKALRGPAQIVAMNADTAVISLDGKFYKVSVGSEIPGYGRVLRVGSDGVQTSEGGWIER